MTETRKLFYGIWHQYQFVFLEKDYESETAVLYTPHFLRKTMTSIRWYHPSLDGQGSLTPLYVHNKSSHFSFSFRGVINPAIPLLIMAGDIEPNPGPPQPWYCAVCHEVLRNNITWIQCNSCSKVNKQNLLFGLSNF